MAQILHKLSRDKRLKIRDGEPIRELGLDWFPISMKYYEDYVQCKDALSVRLASLPVRYASMDYFSAIFAYEYDALNGGKNVSAGLFIRMMKLLGLALRIEVTPEYLGKCIYYQKNMEGRITVEKIIFTQTGENGETNTAELTPFDISFTIRPLISAQNNIPLPDESENIDLVEAYEIKKQLGAKNVNLDIDTDALVSSVAYLSHVTDKELRNTWNVRDFENRKRAIDRVMKYQMYGQAELGGMVTFKNGNPFPSWCFDVIDDSLGTMAYSELEKTLSGVATQGG